MPDLLIVAFFLLSASQTTDSQSCTPQNCVIGGWSSWGACSAGCGYGSQSRSRSITPETCGGTCWSSQIAESQSCNTGCCPQNCQVNTWSQWSACSQTCGTGTRSRNRAVTVLAACGGAACPTDLSQSEACGGSCCAVNCVLSSWSPWTSCSVSCGSGTRSRSRTKETPESCGGTCDVSSESESCSAGCCPSNCVWSAFGAWSGCSVTCGAGTQTRSRTKTTAEACGGSCAGSASETSTCTVMPACMEPPVDCEVSQWAQWSACTATCGTTASKSRTRTTTRAAANGGTPCPSLSESANCGYGCCPVNCVVATWSAWSTCSATCGTGMRSRTRATTTQPMCSGTPCPSVNESETCSVEACATDCQVSMWSNWSACSQACGTGEQRRTRSVVAPAANGGAACGALSESQPCTQPACACAVSAWSNWSPCSASCGGGMTSRSRNVTMTASDCPPLSDSKACSTQPCARDCVLAAWGTWSPCSVTCGGGRRERTRAVAQTAVEPGMACPVDLTESEECANHACTAAGLACSEYTECTDCTDNGKTSPRRCQFCGSSGGVGGLCQGLYAVDGNATSGVQGCAIDFDWRATTIAACSTGTAQTGTATPTGTTAVVIETVDLRAALNLNPNETTALVNITVGNGVRVQVRASGEDGAALRALGADGGIGVWSPSRDGNNAANAAALVRNGLTIEFLFAKDRPVVFRSLTLGEWNDGDRAQLTISNDEFAEDDGADSVRRRQAADDTGVVVIVDKAEWTFDEMQTGAGFTKYAVSAMGASEFSIKSFQFTPGARSIDEAKLTDEPSSLDNATLGGIIAGAVVGALLLIAIVVAVIAVARRKRAAPTSTPATPATLPTRASLPTPIPSAPRSTGIYGSAPSFANSGTYDTVPQPYTAFPVNYESHPQLNPNKVSYSEFQANEIQLGNATEWPSARI